MLYLSTWFNPKSLGVYFGLALLYPVFFGINFIFILLWAYLKKFRYLILPILGLLLNYSLIQAYFGLRFKPEKNLDPDTINICSFNAFEFRINLYDFRHKIKRAEKAWRQISKDFDDPDILLFQEYNRTLDTFFIKNQGYKHYHIIEPKDGSTAIFSKYPILETGDIPFTESGNSATWSDIKIKNNIIRFYSLHLQSSSISKDAENFSKKANLEDKATWRSAWRMIKKYKSSALKRVDQLELVIDHIKSSPYPIIIGTDLNEVAASYVYRNLNNNFKDAFKEKGFGYGVTYDGAIPGLKIDYIFTDKRYKIVSFESCNHQNISDHFPINSLIQIQ